MISQDTVLTAMWTLLNSQTTVASTLGGFNKIVKGPKRPDGLANPCVTVHMPVMELPGGAWFGTNALRRTHTGSVWVNCFADNANNGAMPVATLGTITSNIGSVLASNKPSITGATVHRLGSYSVQGPIYDRADPHESYSVMLLGYWISES